MLFAVNEILHRPVMVDEVLRLLLTRPDGVYVDGTLGAGGHSEAILNRLRPEGKLIGMDRDTEILNKTRERLGNRKQMSFLHGTFDELEKADAEAGSAMDGILLDLGVSSFQLNTPERGFSFMRPGPLDMRMDTTSPLQAKDIVREKSAQELETILREYGEEPFAERIAKSLVEVRRHRAIETTQDLAEIVAGSIPRKAWSHRLHPATRTFQALRIAVNRELDHLKNFLTKAPRFLKKGGRIVILSYHSLEDRLVKQSFLQGYRDGFFERITRKALRPEREEILKNPRSRSAKLRAIEIISTQTHSILKQDEMQGRSSERDGGVLESTSRSREEDQHSRSPVWKCWKEAVCLT